MKGLVRNGIGTAAVLAVICLVGCSSKPDVKAPPPPEVMVSIPLKKEITDYMIFSGRTQPYKTVEMRARVEGWLDKKYFEPGSKVKEGDLLFEIDPRPFQATVDQQEATLEAKKADETLAETNLKRAEDLLAKASISQLQYDQTKAKALVAKAQVGIAQADLEKAELDLAYTKVTAPMDGLVARNYVDEGNLVGAGEKTLLTEIVNNSEIYFYFDISERDYLKLRRKYPNRPDPETKSGVKVGLQLADEDGFPHKGRIDYADPQLDPSTGTLQGRAVFDNKDGFLLGGMFGRLRIPIQEREALLVPETAVGIAQAGRYVIVVNKDNVAEQRLVTTGELKGTLRVIEKGLTRDDRLVVNGVQRARPGSKVRTKNTPISEMTKPDAEDKPKADTRPSGDTQTDTDKQPGTKDTPDSKESAEDGKAPKPDTETKTDNSGSAKQSDN